MREAIRCPPFDGSKPVQVDAIKHNVLDYGNCPMFEAGIVIPIAEPAARKAAERASN